MGKRALLVLACMIAGLLLAPAPSSACERCGLLKICIADDCWVVEACLSPAALRTSWEDCYVDQWGFCRVSGGFCYWARGGDAPLDRDSPGDDLGS